MSLLQEIWMFTVIALFIVMVPGVDSLLVLKNTMVYGKRAGVFTMLGIIVTLFVWTTLTVLGLATIIYTYLWWRFISCVARHSVMACSTTKYGVSITTKNSASKN